MTDLDMRVAPGIRLVPGVVRHGIRMAVIPVSIHE